MTTNMGAISAKPKMRGHRSDGGKDAASDDIDNDKTNIEQWVSRVANFSSEYDASRWCANQVKGQPKVYPRYGDITGAWAPQLIDCHQYLELEFDEPIYLFEINIYETYHAGGISSIKAKSEDGSWHELWKVAHVQSIKTSRIFSPSIEPTTYRTKYIRINVDCSVSGTWVEIDAVKIVGKKFLTDPPPSLKELSDDLQTMVNSRRFSDIQFEIEGEIVYAHKVILCSRSDYFAAMFGEHMKSKESSSKAPIQLVDVKYGNFVALMHFLYTNRLPESLTCLDLVDVCRVADRFSMDGLKALATFLISDKIQKEDVIPVYVEAVTKLPVLEDVKTFCLAHIVSNMSSVVNSKSFTQLPQDIMLEIIQMSAAKISIHS